jgi:hypothetical protein
MRSSRENARAREERLPRRKSLSTRGAPLSDAVLFIVDNSAFMINEDFQDGTRFQAVSHAVQ